MTFPNSPIYIKSTVILDLTLNIVFGMYMHVMMYVLYLFTIICNYKIWI